MAKNNLPVVSLDPTEVSYTGYILSPHADRPVLLNHILHWDKNPLLYTFMKDLDYLGFTLSLIEEFFEGDTKAQKAIHDVLNQKKASSADVGTALVGVLRGYNTIILDGIDRLIATTETIEFITAFVNELSNQEKILVANGRTANLDLWANLIEQGLAAIINEKGEDAHYKHSTRFVEIKLFGTPTVSVNGKVVTQFGGPLPDNLTYYFSSHPVATRDEIFEAFWPELNTKEATNVFHVTKRKISDALGVELTYYKGGFYRPATDITIVNDINTFLAAFDNQNWKLCVSTYKTGFLRQVQAEMPWMQPMREEFQLKYLDSLIQLARQEENAGNFEQAIAHYLQTLPIEIREDAVRGAMSLYHKLNQDEKAIELHKALEEALYRIKVNGKPLRPDPKTIELYKRIAKL